MTCTKEPSKVILWCSARSLSTAFFRSVSQLDEVNVLFEPFSPASVIRVKQRNSGNVNLKDVEDAFEVAIRTLCSDQGGKHLFAKIPSVTLPSNMEMLLTEEIKRFKHVFLIRNPEKVVCSFYRAHHNQVSYFRSVEMAIKAGLTDIESLVSLYEFVKEHFDKDPLVIDSDDLLENPEVVMREFCNRVGFTYDAKMLHWEPGRIPGTENWDAAGWYDGAAKSNGFTIKTSSTYEGILDDDKSAIREVVDQCLPLYEQLYSKRFVPNN